MTIHRVLHYPDPALRTRASPVEVFDDSLQELVDDMYETMYHYKGIGLAATQINIHKQVVVIDTSENGDQPLCFINPSIDVLGATDTNKYQEGSLSVPDYYDDVERPTNICVKYQDVDGASKELTPDGLLAVCIQHECDHLNGKLFIDYLSAVKRLRITDKMRKKAIKNKVPPL